MPDRDVLECPNCALRISVNSSGGSSHVICPTCSRRIPHIGSVSSASPVGPQVEHFDSLPPMVDVASEVAGPAKSKRIVRRAARKARAHSNRDLARQKRLRQIKLAGIGLACLIAVGSLGSLAYFYLRAVPKESWARLVPWMDTPDKLLRSYANICAAFRDTCDSVDSEYSRDRATEQILIMTARLRAFPERVRELGSPTELQRQSFDSAWVEQVRADVRRSQERVRVLRGKRMLLSGDFLTALQQHVNALDAAADSMISAWGEIE